MTINCVWEHNGRDTLLYAVDFVGAYTRGETLEAAVRKMQAEICSYLKWCGKKAVTSMDIVIIEEKVSELAICDADSDVLFESEKAPLTAEEYIKLKALALKSAQDFLALYDSVPDKNAASGDLNRLNLTLIFCKIPSEKAAMARIGHCVKSCAVLSGMTVSTQEPCIEWR